MGLFGKSDVNLFLTEPIEDMSYEELLKALVFALRSNKRKIDEQIEELLEKEGHEITDKGKLIMAQIVLESERERAIEEHKTKKAIEDDEYIRERGRMRARGEF